MFITCFYSFVIISLTIVYILGGNLVTLGVKHHFSCLTGYKNRYRSSLRKKNFTSNTHIEKTKVGAFVELISNIEKKPRKLYKDRLNGLVYDIRRGQQTALRTVSDKSF